MEEKRFYWLKLKKDFFKRHDVIIIENMPNGKDYLLFYLKLLCESVDHDGNLRFSDEIPYNEQMLSTITNTNIDIVRSAIKIFTSLNMMELMDDGTYYMNKVNVMIGSAVDNDNANRQRRFRERQKQLALQECYDGVTNNNESKSKSKNKNKEESINKNIYTKEEKSQNDEKNDKKDVILEIFDFWNSKNIIKHSKFTDARKKAIVKALKEYSVEDIKLAIEHYNIVLKDKDYFFSYVWSIEDFLNRKTGFTTFLSDGSNWVNYNKPKVIKQNNGLSSYEYDPNAPYNNRGDNDII